MNILTSQKKQNSMANNLIIYLYIFLLCQQSDNADSSLDQSSMSMDSQEECLLIDFEGKCVL